MKVLNECGTVLPVDFANGVGVGAHVRHSQVLREPLVFLYSKLRKRFDVVLKLRPTLEAMLSRDDELRASQRCFLRHARIVRTRTGGPKSLQSCALACAMLTQQLLCSFLKLFQRRTRWKT